MAVMIGDRRVDNFAEPYVIAEVGANHNGRMDLAKQMVDEAAKAGCHCVKFQSWSKQSIFSAKVYRENKFLADDYRQREDYNLERIVEEFSLSEDQLKELKQHCDDRDIDFSSSVFNQAEADFLADVLDAPFLKIASMDIPNLPFLEYLATKGKPLVISTGLSTLAEVDQAIQTLEHGGARDIVILHCVSNYPPDNSLVNLRNMETLRAAYPDHPVGFSDHSLGIEIPIAAMALGACVIEKHFTLDKDMFGWDHKVSADVPELWAISQAARSVHLALGSTQRKLTPEDQWRLPAYRRSIVAARDLEPGQTITRDDVDFKRPGTGICPSVLNHLLGRTLKNAVDFDEMITWDDVQ